jgi:hypothetical protein
MDTYAIELGDRVVAYLNGGIDRNPQDRQYTDSNAWGES